MVLGKISKFGAGVLLIYDLAFSPMLAGTLSQLSSSGSIQPIEEKNQKDALRVLEETLNKIGYNAAYFDQTDRLASIDNIEEYIKNNTITKEEMCNELKKESIVILADTHCFTKHRKNMIEIIKNIKRKNLVVGLETFGADTQEYINDYMNSRISLEKLAHNSRNSAKDLEKWGYINLIEFLKKSSIKTIGIDMPYFIVKSISAEASVKVLVDRYSGFDFFNRDLTTTKVVMNELNEKKDIAIVIGGIHARDDHLPYMIEKVTSKKPAIVFQQPYPIRSSTDMLDEYEKFRNFGLTEEKALKVQAEHKEYYLNVKPNLKEMKEYMKMY